MKVTFEIRDTWRTYCANVFEQEVVPHARRTVQVELTPEQLKQISLRKIGQDGGKPVFETLTMCWIESDTVKGLEESDE